MLSVRFIYQRGNGAATREPFHRELGTSLRQGSAVFRRIFPYIYELHAECLTSTSPAWSADFWTNFGFQRKFAPI